MITINDNDAPITVAEKIIYGTRDTEISTILGKAHPDMFDIQDIKEIAEFLLLYCRIHGGEQDE